MLVRGIYEEAGGSSGAHSYELQGPLEVRWKAPQRSPQALVRAYRLDQRVLRRGGRYVLLLDELPYQ